MNPGTLQPHPYGPPDRVLRGTEKRVRLVGTAACVLDLRDSGLGDHWGGRSCYANKMGGTGYRQVSVVQSETRSVRVRHQPRRRELLLSVPSPPTTIRRLGGRGAVKGRAGRPLAGRLGISPGIVLSWIVLPFSGVSRRLQLRIEPPAIPTSPRHVHINTVRSGGGIKWVRSRCVATSGFLARPRATPRLG